MPGKMTKSILRPPFRPPQVLAAVRSSRLSCRKVGKAQIFTSARESSGESRFKYATPKRRAKNLRTKLAEIKAVQRRIGAWGIIESVEDCRTLRAILQSVTAKLQQELAAVANAESRSKYNASKADRDRYLTTLSKIWREIGGTRTQRGAKKALRNFLLDCSSPVCGTNDNAIRHFLYPKTSK